MAFVGRRLPALRVRSFSRSLMSTLAGGNADVSEIRRIGVLGAGQMGLGIALVAAKELCIPVRLVDQSQAALDRSLAFADSLLARDVAKARLTRAEADAARAQLAPSTDLAVLADVDFVIEAVPEILALKLQLFAQLARICPPHAVLATNTSSISVTRIAAAAAAAHQGEGGGGSGSAAAARVVATHFMNPVPVQRGVEIVAGLQTSVETVARAERLCRALGKTPSQSADTPGFLANRILMPYINEAIICLETGVGSRDDIDAVMRNGTNVPMGPLRLADFIGLDTCFAIMQVLHGETGDSKYRPATLLRRMVDAGWFGKKSAKGFYDDYDKS